jgi:hypothetical protein
MIPCRRLDQAALSQTAEFELRRAKRTRCSQELMLAEIQHRVVGVPWDLPQKDVSLFSHATHLMFLPKA